MLNVRTRNRRGFTLIELLVVILILAILAALVVPRMIGQTDQAKRAKAVTDITRLGEAINRFRMDTGRLPSTEEGLSALRQRPSDVNVWNGPYIERAAPPDPWGNEYIYEDQGDGENFLLMSYGQDGAEGGEGNAADITNQDANEGQ